MSALGLFGDAPVESTEDALPANPAEWLASLGTGGEEAPEGGDES